MTDWMDEIVELHAVFEAYFLGTIDSMERIEAAFHPEMTYVGPDGTEFERAEVVRIIRDGHAHSTTLRITTSDHRLLWETDDTVTANYIEHHRHPDDPSIAGNDRRSTVVFAKVPTAPNGVQWVRTHETPLSSE